ncbi:MFS transporter [Frondihabitans sp. PAMC 28766]|uniref:MFS transporter n=1 Tax=Frondihabitans sp. PAMC 28766 TaxID=1795630 RepID=UPI000ADFD6E8|nr:MFS transporter [Frondihabitans sp. PAMC 28766]
MSVETGSIRTPTPTATPRSQDATASAASTRGPLPRWALVWGAVFVMSWGGNQFSPLLLMYENRDHYSSVLVNAFLGVYVLGLAPALLVAGSLSDRHGRRKVMIAGLVSAVVGSGLLAFGGLGPEFLLVGRLFSGSPWGSRWRWATAGSKSCRSRRTTGAPTAGLARGGRRSRSRWAPGWARSWPG